MIRNIPNVTSTYSTITFGLNFMGTFSMCPIFCHWEHCDHISGGHFKCIWLVTLGLHNQGHSKCDQKFTTGHIEVTHWVDIQNVANFWSLGTLWSSVICNHNVFNMCPLGIYPLVPSDSPNSIGRANHRWKFSNDRLDVDGSFSGSTAGKPKVGGCSRGSEVGGRMSDRKSVV